MASSFAEALRSMRYRPALFGGSYSVRSANDTHGGSSAKKNSSNTEQGLPAPSISSLTKPSTSSLHADIPRDSNSTSRRADSASRSVADPNVSGIPRSEGGRSGTLLPPAAALIQMAAARSTSQPRQGEALLDHRVGDTMRSIMEDMNNKLVRAYKERDQYSHELALTKKALSGRDARIGDLEARLESEREASAKAARDLGILRSDCENMQARFNDERTRLMAEVDDLRFKCDDLLVHYERKKAALYDSETRLHEVSGRLSSTQDSLLRAESACRHLTELVAELGSGALKQKLARAVSNLSLSVQSTTSQAGQSASHSGDSGRGVPVNSARSSGSSHSAHDASQNNLSEVSKNTSGYPSYVSEAPPAQGRPANLSHPAVNLSSIAEPACDPAASTYLPPPSEVTAMHSLSGLAESQDRSTPQNARAPPQMARAPASAQEQHQSSLLLRDSYGSLAADANSTFPGPRGMPPRYRDTRSMDAPAAGEAHAHRLSEYNKLLSDDIYDGAALQQFFRAEKHSPYALTADDDDGDGCDEANDLPAHARNPFRTRSSRKQRVRDYDTYSGRQVWRRRARSVAGRGAAETAAEGAPGIRNLVAMYDRLERRDATAEIQAGLEREKAILEEHLAKLVAEARQNPESFAERGDEAKLLQRAIKLKDTAILRLKCLQTENRMRGIIVSKLAGKRYCKTRDMLAGMPGRRALSASRYHRSCIPPDPCSFQPDCGRKSPFRSSRQVVSGRYKASC